MKTGNSYIYGVEYRMVAAFDTLFDFLQTEGAVGTYRLHAMLRMSGRIENKSSEFVETEIVCG